ncbi:hypothetical protein NUU61_008320 [Penicillium alfredii]|uniref:DH domain-containing protein n=1 Tax=Penicillium alfredii TaxID=1506179 RepID=A0A9W9JZ53_9EURO|nr:uncharacterized protein NUU61_008320 [Penicillium alfredii]KAJ5087013.1 hypothetical protein NUU61_008320 [Penicillium alfredii]
MKDNDEVEIEKPVLVDVDDFDVRFFDTEEAVMSMEVPAIAHPFKKWMDSFRPRKYTPRTTPQRFVEGWSDSSQVEFSTQNQDAPNGQEQQWESESRHSSQLGTVKTTTLSIASRSMARSRRTTRSTANQSTISGSRISADSTRPASSHHIDKDAELRATKRRQVLREIITTESDYVLGLKALTGVLSIFNTRPEIYRNIQRILAIHERFLSQLQATSPLSTSNASESGLSDLASRGLYKRLGTIDLPGFKGLQNRSLRTSNFKASVNQRLKALSAEPFECLEVAREIDKLSISFSLYEEFCSNYEILTQDMVLLRRSIPNWEVFDQGIEALSKSVASMDSRKQEENRSMSLNDLLIKPVQRLCKYPLLLQDMLRQTPICDCPSSHAGIEQIVENLRALVARINSATGNPVHKDRIQKTILLQERIGFSDLHPLQDMYRELGPMTLCGVLHVVYRTPESTTGDFMVCILFNCYLLFARGIDDFHRLEAVACLYVDDLKMDTPSNGQGLYCYGCLFSWKLIFQDQEENYEIVLSASSATEERHWKTELLKSSAALSGIEKPGSWDPRQYSFVTLDLVPLDRVQYAAGSLARRSSMDSMAVLRKSHVQHVIIKKTNCPHSHEELTSPDQGEIERPKTPVSRTALTLTARRMERIRLERLVADVYTRDVLPLPGMVLGRGDLFRRGSIMRRLSLHAGFTRRSSSVSTSHSGPVMTDAHSIDGHGGEEKELTAQGEKCEDQQNADGEIPRTITSTMGRSKTLRFKGAAKRAMGAPPSPRSEKRRSQDDNSESSPARKKWTSPMALLSVLSPKNLIRPRPSLGASTL